MIWCHEGPANLDPRRRQPQGRGRAEGRRLAPRLLMQVPCMSFLKEWPWLEQTEAELLTLINHYDNQ